MSRVLTRSDLEVIVSVMTRDRGNSLGMYRHQDYPLNEMHSVELNVFIQSQYARHD